MASPVVPVSYGPVDYPSAGGLIWLAFDSKVDGKGRQVVMIGDMLQLPMTFGRNNESPKQVRITCRDGAIATVRYERGRTTTMFNVTPQELSDTAGEEPQSAS